MRRVLQEAKRDAGYAAKRADTDVVDRVLALIGDGKTAITSEALRELEEIGTSVSETITPREGNGMAANTNTDIERIKEMNKIAADPEGRIALQRAQTGQDLDARQAEIVQRYKALEFAHNEQARKEQHSPGGWMKTSRPHSIPRELYDIERIAGVREKVHAIRGLRSRWRDDPKSAYNDTSNGDHKNAIEWMSRLYQAEQDLGPQPEDEK
jgi:hypothetical protein